MPQIRAMKEKDRLVAEQLFFDGYAQNRIAEILKVSEVTLSRWAKEGNWDQKRVNRLNLKETIEDDLLELISYQLQALKNKKNKWLDEQQTDTLISKGDVDALSKMFATIKGKEMTWVQIVNSFRDFVEYLHTAKPEFIVMLQPHIDDYLYQKKQTS